VTLRGGNIDMHVLPCLEILLLHDGIFAVPATAGMGNRSLPDGKSVSATLPPFGRRVPIFANESGHSDPSCLYRTHVRPFDCRRPMRTIFFEASSKMEALLKIAGVMAVLEGRRFTKG
jgi:hypothetical protein